MYQVWISGKLVDPLVEGGKGVGASDGRSAGLWASCGGVGTFSGTVAQAYDEDGRPVRLSFKEDTRDGRHKELLEYGVAGSIAQAKIAKEISAGRGCIQINVLWEFGAVPQFLERVLPQTQGQIDGVVCGAGLPFGLAEIASRYKVYYNPIVSSALAFSLLWRRSYSKMPEFLGSVIYEDPWVAGGHNGISSREDPNKPERPYERVVALRKVMNDFGLKDTTIVIAGGVWNLAEWREYIEDTTLQPIAFQFGTRPLLTKESPISDIWKEKLFHIREDSVKIHRFSPTGFYSSSISNPFLEELFERSARQIPFSDEKNDIFTEEFKLGRRSIFIKDEDVGKVHEWQAEGHSDPMKTPDNTIIFVSPSRREQILTDQRNCMGCLSRCKFSNWDEHDGSTKSPPDPRSFCILKTLDDVIHGGSVEDNLVFAGKNAYRFSTDPFYENHHIPTVSELYRRICEEYGWIKEL